MYNCVYRTLYETIRLKSKFSPYVKPILTGSDYPIVVIESVENTTLQRLNGGLESISLIGIEINIYTKQMTVGTTTYMAVNVAKEIRNIVDEVCTDMFDMKRVLCKPTPNLDNGAIYRLTMRYNAKQNDNRSSFY
ncbi:MAG: hypothetical protein RR533_02740 [Carnobacterium sp.]